MRASYGELLLRRVQVPCQLLRILLVLCSRRRRRVFLWGVSSLWCHLCVVRSVRCLVRCRCSISTVPQFTDQIANFLDNVTVFKNTMGKTLANRISERIEQSTTSPRPCNETKCNSEQIPASSSHKATELRRHGGGKKEQNTDMTEEKS